MFTSFYETVQVTRVFVLIFRPPPTIYLCIYLCTRDLRITSRVKLAFFMIHELLVNSWKFKVCNPYSLHVPFNNIINNMFSESRFGNGSSLSVSEFFLVTAAFALSRTNSLSSLHFSDQLLVHCSVSSIYIHEFFCGSGEGTEIIQATARSQ